MTNISDLKNAIRKGDTELVREITNELASMNIDISSAIDLAKNINRTKKTRGMWDDIVNILEECT